MNTILIPHFLFLTLFCIIQYITIMQMTGTYEVNYDVNYKINIYKYTYNKALAMGITSTTFFGSILLYIYFTEDNEIISVYQAAKLAESKARNAARDRIRDRIREAERIEDRALLSQLYAEIISGGAALSGSFSRRNW